MIQDPLSFAWTKENGPLPPGRSTDSGYGILIITSVERDDSGTYVCTVTAGAFRVEERLQLQVEGKINQNVSNLRAHCILNMLKGISSYASIF